LFACPCPVGISPRPPSQTLASAPAEIEIAALGLARAAPYKEPNATAGDIALALPGTAYPHLMQPITLGGVRLRNRIVMGSMHTGLEGHQTEDAFDRLARFYAARAKGGAGLIVTGGFSPNHAGRLKDEPATMQTAEHVALHRRITDAVHAEGGAIVLQLLHAGRYGYHDKVVAPSPIRSPINKHGPAELTDAEIEQTIDEYARSALLAREAGYDGVEVMGSEGYLITEFLALRTNHRTDRWGGPIENRARFPVAIVSAIRKALGPDFLIVYRHSVLDLVEGGLSWDETVYVAQEMARAGADLLSAGIGWHEAKVPTIAGTVPHAAFADAVRRLKAAVPIPVTASNRINSAELADRLVANGSCDMVSMARPLLADPEFANKAFSGRADRITTCIACNQACLDHYFESREITCLVNPRGAREAEFITQPVVRRKKIAVVGSGVAGLVCAIEAAARGHEVTLFEAEQRLGGQMNLAARIPGKADYADVVRAYAAQLGDLGAKIVTRRRVAAPELLADGFDEFIIATGVRPRPLDLPGADDPRVVSYEAALSGSVGIGSRVAVIGAGGIGHDVALCLAHPDPRETLDPALFAHRWGIDGAPQPSPAKRQITLIKRSPGPFGRTLGKSTGWILRQELRDFGVDQLAGAAYRRIDADGLHLVIDDKDRCVAFDTLVVCAGQLPDRTLADALTAAGRQPHVIGGARHAAELDARRAIEEGTALGCTI
jgi:2,4-dienoyl-CoA reductase (NADPH2)